MKLVMIAIVGIMLSGCSSAIQSANTARALGSLSSAGITESATNCIKDIFDPGNRGSGC